MLRPGGNGGHNSVRSCDLTPPSEPVDPPFQGPHVHGVGRSGTSPARRGNRVRPGPGGAPLAHTRALLHSLSRRCAVAPDGPTRAAGSCCHVHPDVATNTIAVSTSRVAMPAPTT